jgi:hypothetical protein
MIVVFFVVWTCYGSTGLSPGYIQSVIGASDGIKIYLRMLELLSGSEMYVLHNCGELLAGSGKMLTLPALLIADSGVHQI